MISYIIGILRQFSKCVLPAGPHRKSFLFPTGGLIIVFSNKLRLRRTEEGFS